MDNQENHDDPHDPQFAKVLQTCLKMEIATMKEGIDANIQEIKQLKMTMRIELNKRKELKQKITQMNKIRLILSETLTKLRRDINEVSATIEIMKANADDQYTLMQLRAQEYQDIVAEYKKTWNEYHDAYEEFPLAKARNAVKNNLEKLKIEHMVLSYKKTEVMTIIKQRQRINWIRMRGKIIEFATVRLESIKLNRKLTELKVNVKYHRQELKSIETELQILHRKMEEDKRQRKQKILEMAPPKINIPLRETIQNIYAQNQIVHTKLQHRWKQPLDEDTISVNTLFLEELCIDENVTVPSERMDVEEIHDNDYKLTTVETEVSNFKNAIVSEKDDTRAAESDAESNAEKATLTNNNVKTKETHHEETPKSQESVKTQPSCRTKESSLKHSAVKNIQDEIEAKRMRLQRQDSKESIDRITTPLPTIVEEMGLKPLSHKSGPKIKKIETVYYDVTPLMPTSKYIQRPTTTANNMFTPTNYEYCDSNLSSIDRNLSKGPSSLYEGSMCNYKLSPISNISSIYAVENARMGSPPKYAIQQENKTKSDDDSAFQFNDFMKNKKDSFKLF